MTAVVSAANSAARNRPRTPGQQPRAVDDETAAAAGGPASPELGVPDDSAAHADADASRATADRDLAVAGLGDAIDPETGELDDFGEFDDEDDADLEAALAGGELEEPDLADVAELAEGDLVGEDLVSDEAEGPDGIDALDGPEPDQAAADAEADGPEAAGALVVNIALAGGEDEEILVFGDDDDDLPAAQVADRKSVV